MIGTFPKKEVARLLVKLAETPGPSLGEGPRREYLASFFDKNGIRTTTDAAGNLWVSIGDGVWPEAVVLDAHIDVVENGFCPKVRLEENRLIGRGVADNLAAVSLLALMATQIDVTQLRRPLRLLFSVGEEGIGNLKGVRRAVKDHPVPPHLFIAFDLDYATYSLSSIGSSRYRVCVQTPGGHSWENFGVPNAIEILGLFLTRIRNGYMDLIPEHSPPRTLTFNIGSVHGGSGINAIAREAEAEFEFRSKTPDLLDQCATLVKRNCSRLKGKPDLDISLENMGKRAAASAVNPERLEAILQEAMQPLKIESTHVSRSTSINATLSARWPSICVGLCRCGNIHRPDEYLETPSLSTGWRLLESLIRITAGK